MALETGSFIGDLNASFPVSTDGLAQADDHMRLIKSTIKTSFPTPRSRTKSITSTRSQFRKTIECRARRLKFPKVSESFPGVRLTTFV